MAASGQLGAPKHVRCRGALCRARSVAIRVNLAHKGISVCVSLDCIFRADREREAQGVASREKRTAAAADDDADDDKDDDDCDNDNDNDDDEDGKMGDRLADLFGAHTAERG